MELVVKVKKIRKPRVKVKFNTGTITFTDKKKIIDRKKKYKNED